MEINEILTFDALKAMHREERGGFEESLSIRVHRALSWLKRAEQEADDADARFMFLWVSFNAAYAQGIHDRERFGERRLLVEFLHRLIAADADNWLYKTVWERFSGSVRILLDNHYVYQPFWNHQMGKISEDQWQESFRKNRIAARKSLGDMNTKKLLAIMFDRLYTLRNQLLHGGSTWGSSINRSQVIEGVRILEVLVPLMIFLMMKNSEVDWGQPCFPVVT